MSTVIQDVRYAIRWLRKNPGFTAVAVATLALGIGANTALFSVLDAVLLKKLPVREPERLVLFEWEAGSPFRISGRRGSGMPRPPGTRGGSIFLYDIFEKMRETRAKASGSPNPLSDLFAFAPIYEVTASTNTRADVVGGQVVSGGYYAGLGVPLALGRGITEKDDHPGADPVVVLSHAYWQRLGASPDVLGQSLKLNQTVFTIVGVTPPGFAGTLQVDYHADVTAPLSFEPAILGGETGMARDGKPGIWWLNVMGRLAPGATREQAAQSLHGTFQAAALDVMPAPERDGDVTRLEPKDYPRLLALPGGRGLREHRRSFERPIFGLSLVVSLVLLIACANLANLLWRGPRCADPRSPPDWPSARVEDVSSDSSSPKRSSSPRWAAPRGRCSPSGARRLWSVSPSATAALRSISIPV